MLNRQRGQTMPFWLITMVVALALTFFLMDYMNIIGWQVRAQNAADAAVGAALSARVNVLNQESTLLYTSSVDEYRMRYLAQGMINAINRIGCSDTDPSQPNCQNVYSALLTEYNAALNAYQGVGQLIQEANNFTQGGQTNNGNDEQQLVNSLGKSNNDGFVYTILSPSAKQSTGYPGNVDLVACKSVTYQAWKLLQMKSATFQAVGHAAGSGSVLPSNPSVPPAVIPSAAPGYSEYFQPGVKQNPLTGAAYQPIEDPGATGSSPYFSVDYGNLGFDSTGGHALTVDVSWYVSNAIKPFFTKGNGKSLTNGDYKC